MRIVWDEPKRQANITKHGLDFADLTMTFFERAVVRPARSPRFMAFGRFEDGTIAVVFATLGTEAISVISMRRANAAERMLHDQAKGI
jgi:uncharacterized DUF497 family protein